MSKGQPLQQVQMMVSKIVLEEPYCDVLIRIRYSYHGDCHRRTRGFLTVDSACFASVVNDEVCLVWNEDGVPYQKSLKEISLSDSAKDKQTLDYFK